MKVRAACPTRRPRTRFVYAFIKRVVFASVVQHTHTHTQFTIVAVVRRRREKMDHHINGLLRVRVIRGVNLAVRDLRSSDPYAVVKMGKQKVRTRVVKRNVNPEWNEELTLTISDVIHPIRIEVYDKDTFTRDDSMGFAEIDLHPFMEAVETRVDDNSGTVVVQKILPNKQNFLVQESCIKIVGKKVIQDLYLRLQDVECGEVELQLEWISIKKPKKL